MSGHKLLISLIELCVYVLCGSVVSDSCDSTDCSPPGSSVRGTVQERILEWVAIPFSRRSSWLRDRTCLSCIGRRVILHSELWLKKTKQATCFALHSMGPVGPKFSSFLWGTIALSLSLRSCQLLFLMSTHTSSSVFTGLLSTVYLGLTHSGLSHCA